MRHLNIEQQLIFCEKYSITPNELLLFEIILIAQEGDDPSIVNSYFSTRIRARGGIIELLSGLKESGLINKTYNIPEKGSKLNLYDIPINKNIAKDFYKCSFDIGKELYEVYPLFGIINGVPVGIRSVSKKFDSLEDFYKYYGKTIRWKPEVHNHIIELVNWAKEQDILCTTLANFVIDHKWEELEAIQKGDIGNMNMNAIKLA